MNEEKVFGIVGGEELGTFFQLGSYLIRARAKPTRSDSPRASALLRCSDSTLKAIRIDIVRIDIVANSRRK
jgi:hypothetical protein